MKKIINSNNSRLCLIVSIIVCLLSLPRTSVANPKEIAIAYLQNGLGHLNSYERQIALQSLANKIFKTQGFNIKLIPFVSFFEMQQSIIQGDIDFSIINSFHYLSHHPFFQQYTVNPIWTVQRGTSAAENYILIANNQHTGKSLADFKNKTISLYKEHLLLEFYLDFLTKKESGQIHSAFFSKIKYTNSISLSVLDVFFGNSDLCLVSSHVFDLATELNPAIKKKVTIIHQSGEKFLPGLLLGFKHVDPSIRHIIDTRVSKFDTSPVGQKILELLSIQRIRTIRQEELSPMLDLFKNYQVLQ